MPTATIATFTKASIHATCTSTTNMLGLFFTKGYRIESVFFGVIPG